MKITQYHHVVNITSQDLINNFHLLSIPKCELHPELKKDLLCKDHDVVFCKGCLVTEHKACKNVVPLDVAAKEVKNSELFQDIKHSMAANKKVSIEVMEEQHASGEELKRQEQRIRKEIANIKSKFMEHINNLEKSLLNELATIPKENTIEIEKAIQKIEQVEREIEANENAVTFVAEHGSESQMFSFLLKLKKEQFEIKEKLENIHPTSRVSITLEEACHKIEAISSLGFLSVRYDSVTKSEEKINQSGILNSQDAICPQMKVEKEMEIDPKHFFKEKQDYRNSALMIIGFVVTEENQLLVLGKNAYESKSSCKLVKYGVDMKFVKSYDIVSSNDFNQEYSQVFRLTCVPKSQQVVVSDAIKLHFVTSKTMTKMWPSLHLTVNNFGLASVRPDGSIFFLYSQNLVNFAAVNSNGSIYMAVEDGIDVMHPREQQLQKVFTCSPDTANQIIGLEIYKDNSTCIVLYRKEQDRLESYSLQVLRALE